jgi:hypothetical protein
MLSKTKIDTYQRIEAILEEGPFVSGTRVVHRGYFLNDLRWSQAGSRISEMNDLGWKVASVLLPEDKWQGGIKTGYRLDNKPLRAAAPKSLYESAFMRQRRKEKSLAAPLFAEVEP